MPRCVRCVAGALQRTLPHAGHASKCLSWETGCLPEPFQSMDQMSALMIASEFTECV